MKNKKSNLTLLIVALFISFCLTGSVLAENGSKIECMRTDNGTTILPDGNMATVGQNITLNCMGKPGAFTGDTTLDLSGSTGNESIATVMPQTMTVSVNQDGSTPDAQFIIMSSSAGTTDVAVDFFGPMNFDVLGTIWTFQEPSSGGSGEVSMTGSSTSSGGTTTSTSSSGGFSSDICSSAILQCKAKSSRKECRTCCSSVVAISSSDICKAKCLKKCKKLKH